MRKSPALFQSTNEFIFDEDSFTILQSGDVASGTSTTRYEALLRVYETPKAFYLYLTPQQAFLLSKGDFAEGVSGELRALLASKLPRNKYVVCR